MLKDLIEHLDSERREENPVAPRFGGLHPDWRAHYPANGFHPIGAKPENVAQLSGVGTGLPMTCTAIARFYGLCETMWTASKSASSEVANRIRERVCGQQGRRGEADEKQDQSSLAREDLKVDFHFILDLNHSAANTDGLDSKISLFEHGVSCRTRRSVSRSG